LEVFGDEVSFQYPKNMKTDIPHAIKDQTRPKFEGIASYGPCHAPGHPQTSQIQLKIVEKQIFVKKLIYHWFFIFCAFLGL